MARRHRVNEGSWRPYRSSPVHRAAHDDFLQCYLATHIDSPGRAQALHRLAKSIHAQVPSPMTICVSWHAASSVRADVLGALEQLACLRCVESKKKLSQFQHLAGLVLKVAAPQPSWVCFSDDDDLWHPSRGALFRAECLRADEQGARVVVCRRKARPRPDACVDARKVIAEPQGADDVSRLLACGDAQLTDSNRVDGGGAAPNEGGDASYHRAELFDFAVRFEVLASFVHLAPEELLAHRLCDLGFVKWLRDRESRIQRFLPAVPEEWVYWYSMALGTSSASHVAIDEAERQLAAAAQEALHLFRTTERASEWLAILRERLEQELVMLRAQDLGTSGDGVAPRQLVDAVCGRQVQILVQGAAHSFERSLLPRVLEWTMEHARGPVVRGVLRRMGFAAVVCTKSLAVERICTSESDAAILERLLRG